MCRLVAYAGPATTVGPLVYGGAHSLYRQSWEPRELRSGSVNADGWGVAWWAGGDPRPRRIARAEPIWYDPTLRTLLDGQTAHVAQATLRNATPGLPVDRSGVSPFVLDGWAFTLNGWVPAFRARHMRALRSELSDARYAALTGVSDAETLFLLTLDEIDRGRDVGAALTRVADRVRERMGPGEAAALTLVASSAAGVTTLHTSVGGALCNSLYLAEGSSVAPQGSVLASEPLDGSGLWEAVAPHTLVVQAADGRAALTPV